MPFTGSPTSSVQHVLSADGGAKIEPRDASVLHSRYANYTHTAGAGVGEINMLILPPGRIRIYPDLCRQMSSAMVATANLSLGHRAYTQEDGTAIAESLTEWLTNADAGSALDAVIGDGGTTLNQYESRDGIIVAVDISTANIEDTDTIQLLMVFSYV